MSEPNQKQTKTCPVCKRPTRPGGTKLAEFPGTVTYSLSDGTCLKDARAANGYQPPLRKTPTSSGYQAARDVAARIAAARAARGVPADGVARIRIVNSRGRILRVPQPA